MATDGFQRARSPEHKRQRRDAILDAATELARRDGVRAVSLSDVARAVGIHKSALLRYFETREQIFLVVAAREWRAWEQATCAALAEATAQTAAAVLATSFVERPLLCDLLPHGPLHLERHASLDAVRTYKQTSQAAVDAVARALRGPLARLPAGARREAVSDIALLAGSLYQIATPPPPLADLYRREPELGHSLLDLPGRLTRAAEVVIAGLSALG